MKKEIIIRTDLNISYVADELFSFQQELEKENNQLSIETKSYIEPPIIHMLTINILGGVSVYLISKLIDVIVKKIIDYNQAKKIKVKIEHHSEQVVIFKLPEQKEEALKYFKELEDQKTQ